MPGNPVWQDDRIANNGHYPKQEPGWQKEQCDCGAWGTD